MSVVERLEDVYVMLENGRHEGALNSVLTAISGASRARYPKGQAMSRRKPGQSMGDHEAFVTFLDDQVSLLGVPRLLIKTPDGDRPFTSVLYELFRCTLSHEAGLTGGGTLVPDPINGYVHLRFTSLDPLGFEISYSTIVLLADLVARAPEHKEAAADVRARIMSRLPQFRGV